MIIKAKLKPFSEWPCQRDGLIGLKPAFDREMMEKLSGLWIEIDTDTTCADEYRKGWAWAVTYASVQRMNAVGALARYDFLSLTAVQRIRICEHIIQSPSVLWMAIRNDLARWGLWKSHPDKDTGRDWRVGKFFFRDWTSEQNGQAVWKGTVLERLGDRGWPLFHIALRGGYKIFPDIADDRYLVSLGEIQRREWHFFSTAEEMEAVLASRIHSQQHSSWSPPIPEQPN
jgi:hypothetical protein